MKTKLFLSALTLGAMMTTFVACDKEEPYVDPGKVIESEVVDPGTAEEVEETDNGTEGISLSYESWIVVHQVFADGSTSQPQTRTGASALAGNKISVVLESRLTDVSAVADVSGFELNEAVSKIDYRELGSAKHETQSFVTVIDSATVYTVDYGIFAVEFVLPYQAAVYDDGITKVTMPYHKYTDVRDNGGELSDLESVTENGVTYLRKLYKHSIVADFNGKSYTVNAEIVLRKEQKGDYLLSQKVVGEGVELVSYDLTAKTGVSKSWITIEETWSESGTKEVKKEVLLYNGLSDEPSAMFRLPVDKEVSFSSLKLGDLETSVSEYGKRSEDGFKVTKHLLVSAWPVTSSEDESANRNYSFRVTYETAVYSDEYITYEMPYLSFDNAKCSISQISEWQADTRFSSMFVSFSSSICLEEQKYNFIEEGEIRCKY